jgi:hypothetical protein
MRFVRCADHSSLLSFDGAGLSLSAERVQAVARVKAGRRASVGNMLFAALLISLGLVVAGVAMHAIWLAVVGGVSAFVSGLAWVVRGPRPPRYRDMDDHSTVDPKDVSIADDSLRPIRPASAFALRASARHVAGLPFPPPNLRTGFDVVPGSRLSQG